MALQVDNPIWLLAFIPVVLVLFLYVKDTSMIVGARKIILVAVRATVFTLVILALAGVHILWPIGHVATAFVVDRSHSVATHEQTALENINDALHLKAPEDQAGVITTGAEAMVEIPLSDHVNSIEAFETETNPAYTNLGAGLQLAGSLFSANDQGRIVVMSDGNENIGDAVRQADYLHEQGYIVDVLPFSSVYKDDVALSSFNVPENIYLGEQAKLSMTIESTIDTTSRIRIIQDGETIINQTVDVKTGTNQLSFSHLVSSAGFHTFKAEITAAGDQVIENNQLAAYAETKGLPHVLLVEGKPEAASNLEAALDASAVRVETIPTELLPTELSNYLNYDSIVFSNVSAHMMSEDQMTMIERAVKDFGVGFVMTGGDQSFGVGGYFKTPIEQLLPVDMDIKGKKEMPSLGLMMVVDKSGSMSGAKISHAREAAARSIELLREQDTLGVIAFDSVPWQIVETGPLDDKEAAMNKVRSIIASGGTDIFTPTAQAYDQLMNLELQRKHIVLLTDGQSATSLNYQEMIEDGLADGVTLSTVAIGTDADSALLEEMSQLGNGRFYQVINDSSIPTILSRETALITRTYIEDDPFYPKIAGNSDWNGHFENGVPQMNAYIATTPKGRAQQMLVSEKDDPVLARWQYGLGKTVAWTSDLSGEWAGDWPAWANWSNLWNDVVSWSLPQYETEAYQVEQTVEGNQITLDVTAPDSDPSILDATLISDAGEEVEFNLQPKAPGEYQGTFESNEPGVYFLQLSEQQGDEIVGSFKTGIIVPYSQEYAFTPTNQRLLEAIATSGGGQVIESIDGVFSNEGLAPRYDRQNLFYLLLTLALLLFLLDVALRRFRFSFAFLGNVNKVRKEKQVKQSKATEQRSSQLGQLRQASKKKTERKPVETKEPIQPVRELSEKKPVAKQQPKQDKPASSNAGESREEKMARLLKAKNRRSK
ncbi:VWA domain-containing protein [Radiobacillus sp. PE A8.2]|uniref:VWA domain-containing protein n=1 Tax=Radiobacillus sp. PE A8.2 TaxID=3380349 RepID=UPI00388E86F2